MKTSTAISLSVTLSILLSSGVSAVAQGRGRPDGQPNEGRGPRPNELGVSPAPLGAPGIAWYGTLEPALEEALRTNRPILFMAAASQCGGVPGVF